MNTPRCGKCRQPVGRGPQGGYVCGSCWYVVPPPANAALREVTTREVSVSGMHCAQCGAEITYGPEGGYVCGNCNFVVEPPGAAQARKDAAKDRANRQRRAAEDRAMQRR
ncbi:hypothetical protein [Kitasatospora sp. NPDC097691]|uniref:hypothetical protein n=1 Tax=Kitasatospora sp. NPDC097691 TaxID=3157231 RepID=UPI00332F233E